MELREKGLDLIVYLNTGEEISKIINKIVREYKIIDAKVTGYGWLSFLEYGVLIENDPIFSQKNHLIELVTVGSLIGLVEEHEMKLMVSAATKKGQHIGEFINGTVVNEFSLTISIIKNDI
ncbi:hypothetical protein STIUS_v1c03330 [Spiroplasma sp. TIUS-1]|uniref:hypothetical protein n=1 Tax=Spiroplasma sp. TIUS-1 TaxID=216963 RepID=UPI001398D941|nr:hypothetical protein [Spiroplasma sp. TIUS-1]QHX35887.1 hypothetical protein STIUS_v1c03330 [Spiroplasma sp. TIUS-1]